MPKFVRNYQNMFSSVLKQMKSFHQFSIIMVAISFVFLVLFVSLTISSESMHVIYHYLPFLQRWVQYLTQLEALPLIIIALPTVGAVLQTLSSNVSEKLRDGTIVLTSLLVMFLVLALYPNALVERSHFEFEQLLGLGMSFHIDMLTMVMLVLTSVIWFFVMIYSHEYVMFEKHRNRFYIFMAITYSAILGTIMAGDLLTMFLFFEAMTFSSYMLVTHVQKSECFDAGYTYIFMGIIGGLAILLAIILLYSYTGDLSFVSMASQMAEMGSVRYLIIILLVFGFGIKAGMAPVHVWLPKAHPVAPTPASALLSGVMIKIGAYGILRTSVSYLFPTTSQISESTKYLWEASHNLGFAIIWLGIITMAIGVFFALQQSNMKKMLAYHSISQMGYILLGIGVTLYLGYKGAMGYSGALYHIINHALFKSLLFMVAGVVYLQTKELNMYKLGGLWRKMPLTALIALIAVLGITGMPLFNGFASKSLLHHSIVEAYQYGHSSFYYAEIMFNIISAGTVCSFIKLFGFTFLGKLPKQFENIDGKKFKSMHLAMGMLALIIVFIGFNPGYIMNQFIVPSLNQVTFEPAFLEKYIYTINFFNMKDMVTMVWIYAFGASIFYFGIKYHWFHLHLPVWMSVEFLIGYPFAKLMSFMCKVMGDCQCEEDVIDLENKAFNLIKGNEQHELSMTERLVSTASIFTNRYETKIIKNDVLIYAVGSTIVLIALMIVG